MPNVRASSGMIGTMRWPKSFARRRSFSSRTNAMVVAISCVPEPFFGQRVRLVARELQSDVVRAALRQEAAERAAALEHVLDRLVLLAGVVVRRQVRVLFELRVRDRDAHRVAEVLEILERHLLHLVGRVAALEVVTEAVALDRLGEDDGGLALVLDGGLVGGVDLAVVEAAAAELAPDVVVRPVLHERRGALVARRRSDRG